MTANMRQNVNRANQPNTSEYDERIQQHFDSNKTNIFPHWFKRLQNHHSKPKTKFYTKTLVPPVSSDHIVHQSNDTLGDYRGVHNLKQFWNNRISANTDLEYMYKSSTIDNSHSSRRVHNDSALNSSKSTACLLNCKSAVTSRNQDTQRRLSIDNFYKYKTAATKKSVMSVNGENRDIISFPQIAATPKGGKIHWAKRDDIVKCRNRTNMPDILGSSGENNHAVRSNDVQNQGNAKQKTVSLSVDNNINEMTTPVLEITNDIELDDKTDYSISAITTTKTVDSNKTSSANSSFSHDSPVRKRNLNATRKYSFKTHTKSYYVSRKMGSNSSGVSKVAILTQKFNEMIQKDAGILHEVKRNKGVLITRAGHVYKIKEEGGDRTKSKATKKSSGSEDDSISLKSIHRKKGSDGKNMCSTIDQTSDTTVDTTVINNKNSMHTRKFDNGNKNVLQKPKVPTKSEEVLQRTREIVVRNSRRKHMHSKEINSDLKPKVLEEITEEKKGAKEALLMTEKFEDTKSETDECDSVINSENDDDKQSSKKNKYVQLYEKLRFRSPFSSKKGSPGAATPPGPLSPCEEEIIHKPLKHSEIDCIAEDFEGDRKILEAIESASKKIENLSKVSAELHTNITDGGNAENNSLVLPNNSFLFRSNPKTDILTSLLPLELQTLAEAVNTRLINDTECANETRFTNTINIDKMECKKYLEVLRKPNKLPPQGNSNQQNDEELYESISISNMKGKVEPSMEEEVYESISDEKGKFSVFENHTEEDGYEICDPPEPPPPRKSEPDIRNTTDDLPAIPAPKRPLPTPNYHVYNDRNSNNFENIYDTIKGSDTYDILQPNGKRHTKSLDTFSLSSNCYESISSYKRIQPLRSIGSTSTISSDHKTNSLYGLSMGSAVFGCHSTNGGSSDNSDDWVDISDHEDAVQLGGVRHQFIVVRERAKAHRSPDWSKRVRDKRLHQAENSADECSDHYYEPLFLPGRANVITSTPMDNNHKETRCTGHKSKEKQNTAPMTSDQDKCSVLHDEYDSFDTDDNSDDEVKKNDSGVDISNANLPEPPQSTNTNQVYAFVKKFKKFISNKKSPSSSKSLDLSAKVYENTKFYVASSEYQNTEVSPVSTKSHKPRSKFESPKNISSSISEDPYENSEFHTPIDPEVLLESSVFTDDKSTSTVQVPIQTEKVEPMCRKKTKTGKSFKSKLRKSLIGSNVDTQNVSTTLSCPRSTFYVSDANDMDSGIFEKVTTELNSNSNSTREIQKPSTMGRKSKKQSTVEQNRRKTTIGIRPFDPPPPPPIEDDSLGKRSTTSWYDECGVFNKVSSDRKDKLSNSSLYAEAGLYQTSGASVASSSGSSGVSTGGENGASEDNSHSMFNNEPLYQIYSAAKLKDMDDQDSMDGYEEIGALKSSESNKKQNRPSALQIVSPRQGPSRTLWSEIPEVISSEVLATLSPVERRLQEAKFEILTSEASYLKSLNLLNTHFMNHPAFRDTATLSSSDRKTLFSHIIPVHECSIRFLADLEACWQDNIMLYGLSKSIYANAEKNFQVYISFCEHQGKMDRTLRRLRESKGAFSQTLDKLESDSLCCGLNLHSFLMLPMQRITRLPLLIDAVFSKVKPDDDEYEEWKMTLAILNKIVTQCNDAANRCEQAYEIERISRQIEFPSTIRSLPIAPVGMPTTGSKPRYLVKKGELTQIIWRSDDVKLTFGKKFSKLNIFAFLFSDLLVLTKRKGEEQFVVFDYCPRNLLTVVSGESIPHLPIKDINQSAKHLIQMTLLENCEKKMVELFLSCPSVSEQQRWLQATTPPEAKNPGEKLYEQWDCPQVIAKHEYIAAEPDILSLDPGDVVNVTRKLPDGWYHGERIRDGASGWFPGTYTEEVNSAHVRARNLKQRYRLLTFTATYLESQKRK